MNNNGVIFVAAAGNDGESQWYGIFCLRLSLDSPLPAYQPRCAPKDRIPLTDSAAFN